MVGAGYSKSLGVGAFAALASVASACADGPPIAAPSGGAVAILTATASASASADDAVTPPMTWASASAIDADSADAAASGAPFATAELSLPPKACARNNPVVRSSELGSELEVVPIVVRRMSRTKVDECIRQAREKEPNLEGLLFLDFAFRNGAITRTRVSAGVGDVVLHNCVEAVFDNTAIPNGLAGRISHLAIAVCGDGRSSWNMPREGWH